MEFSGRLASFPLGDLLQWACQEQRTGALIVRRSQREKRVYFVEGQVVACISDDPFEYYGQFLSNYGHISQKQLVRALTWCRQHDERLGVALSALEILSEEQVQATLRDLFEDLVCDLFLWRRGVFYFERESRPVDDILPRPIDPVHLALEGSRWVDEYERMRTVFVHDNVIVRPGDPSVPCENHLEETVRRAVASEIPIGELYETVKGSYFRFLEATFRLTVAGGLDIHEVGEEASGSTSMELRVADLMLEQAAEEQVLFSKQHLALPIDVINRFCPIWVGDPASQGRERMPPWAVALADQIDGATRLEALWAEDRAERHRQADFLVLQLRKGTLALLPEPLPTLEAREPKSGGWLQRLFGRRPVS